jgi:hypothetical protein
MKENILETLIGFLITALIVVLFLPGVPHWLGKTAKQTHDQFLAGWNTK